MNLQVQVDGTNDRAHCRSIGSEDFPIFDEGECVRGLAWKTSVTEGADIGQWRWPART